jgi:hypothetical protein
MRRMGGDILNQNANDRFNVRVARISYQINSNLSMPIWEFSDCLYGGLSQAIPGGQDLPR